MTTARYSSSIQSVAVATSVATSDAIDFSSFEIGRVHVPSGSSLTTLTFHDSLSLSGTYLPSHTDANVAVTLTVTAGRSYPFPSALIGSRFLKITGNAAGVVGVTMKD